jgi:exonuclease SbcD
VGGAGTVRAPVFDGFDYVALGHLHRPQEIAAAEKPGSGRSSRSGESPNPGAPPIQYAGSLMKYSFSEAAHEKCVKIVEMDGSGRCVIERINLRPRYDVRRIAGTLAQGTIYRRRQKRLSPY